jgi:tetratricopeptide (TPR) repeat protein
MGTWLVVGFGVLALCPQAVAGGLDKPAFSASAAELLTEAGAVGGDAPAIVLRDEITTAFDDAGRRERRFRVVVAIKQQAAVDNWGTLDLDWSPFYQDKPTVRARVIGTDRQVAELDPTLVTDAPAVSESSSVFSDRRSMKAPLPRLTIGSVIEEEFVIKDREPLLKAGIADLTWVGRGNPVQRTVVTISAPVARKIKVVARAFAKPPAPRQSTSNGRATWIYDIGPLEARNRIPPGMAGDVPRSPYIGVSTAASWSAVAADYRQIVEKRLADGPITVPNEVHGATERETVDRTVAWLHEHVRYTGIELADAAIVPWTPHDTLTRGFGDCKDKATLLVAALRSAGVPADIVLLSTGAGWDLDRTLPGMGVFDHAIVRARVGGKDLWIDATEDSLPAGQLPARDQARAALVVATGTRDLVVTPTAAPADNLHHEIRRYHLAELDNASLTEERTESGIFVADLRDWIRDTKRDDVTKYFTGYFEREFHAKLHDFSSTDVTDKQHPFTVTANATDVRRAFTSRKQIDVYLFPTHALRSVPSLLTDDDKQLDSELEKRTEDYSWFRPHVREIESHLEVPPGYDIPTLVATERQTLGTMTFTTTRVIAARELVITYRLDTGKTRISAAELRATRTAVQALWNQPAEHVVLARTAAALVHRGKLKEAIAEMQRLIALHPKEALHYDELAETYRITGMGEAARRNARKAVALEPTSADAFARLGWMLNHDLLGRDHGDGADRKAAIAAYRKAVALDPTHEGALNDLATMLAHDDNGYPTKDPHDRLEAIALWRRAKAAATTTAYDESIAEALLATGDLAEAEKAARALPESDVRSTILLTAVALARGAPEALSVASSVAAGAGRKQILASVAGRLSGLRKYDLMRAIFAEARGPDTDPNLATIYDRWAAVDFGKLDPADPKTPAIYAFGRMMGMSSRSNPPWDSGFDHELSEVAVAVRKMPLAKMLSRLAPEVAGDLVVALAHYQVEGSAADGWRIQADVGAQKSIFYVVTEGARAKLIGMADARAGVGSYLFALLAKNDGARAGRLLQQVAADMPSSALPLLASLVKLVRDKPPTRAVIELAAASFVVIEQPKIATPILQRCAPGGDDIKKLCWTLLIGVSEIAKEWTIVDDLAHKVADQDPANLEAIGARVEALVWLGRVDDAQAMLDRASTTHPDDVTLLRDRVRAAVAGPWDKAQPWLDKLLASPEATIQDINNVAWTHLFFDPDPTTAKQLGVRAEQMAKPLPAHVANTLAAIAAESDDPYAAWRYVERSFEGNDPREDDWYVIGRIAESYGLTEDAIAAYKRVKPNLRPGPTGYAFARRGLKRLHAPN